MIKYHSRVKTYSTVKAFDSDCKFQGIDGYEVKAIAVRKYKGRDYFVVSYQKAVEELNDFTDPRE